MYVFYEEYELDGLLEDCEPVVLRVSFGVKRAGIEPRARSANATQAPF